MDKIQEQLIDAHKTVLEIDNILDIVATDINFKTCDKRIIEDYAILNANLPLIKAAIEDILDVSGVITTTDIAPSGTPFIRYLEDANFNPITPFIRYLEDANFNPIQEEARKRAIENDAPQPGKPE